MSRRIILAFLIIVLLGLPALLFGQAESRIIVLDFDVQSEKDSYKHLGKGFAEFIAIDLTAAKDVTIIDREKRNEALKEQKFTISGLADESTRIDIGNMLAANYLISGTIFDIFGQLEVAVKLIDIASGSVKMNAKAGGEPKNYQQIIAELSASVLDSLYPGTGKPQKPEAATEKAANLNNKEADVVLSSFSDAMDAVDSNDTTKAKKKLKAVQKIDSTNAAARYYLNKLQAQSPKFRVDIVEYVTPYSAATLGFIENGTIYFWSNSSLPIPWLDRDTDTGSYIINDDFAVKDDSFPTFLGFSLPLGKNMGLGAGITMTMWDLHARYIADVPNTDIFAYNGSFYSDPHYSTYNYGAYASFGFKPVDWLGLGCSVMGQNIHPAGSSTEDIMGKDDQLAVSIYPGVMVQSRDGTIVFDFNAVYTNQKVYYVDITNSRIIEGQMPVVIDSSVTYGLSEQKIFLGLKGVSDIYIDSRTGHALRIIPMVEWWPFDFLSVRGGYEYSHLDLMDTFTIGHGGVVGFTLKLGTYAVNGNFTFRQKPVRELPGSTVPDMRLMIGIEYTPDWLSR